jgi:hypothetical protein
MLGIVWLASAALGDDVAIGTATRATARSWASVTPGGCAGSGADAPFTDPPIAPPIAV